MTLSIGNTKSLASPGLKVKDIYNKHLGEIIRHPQENKLIAMKNQTDLQWTAKNLTGRQAMSLREEALYSAQGLKLRLMAVK